jgi:hypothetical protein
MDAAFRSLLNKTGIIYRPTQNAVPNSFGERRVDPGTAILTDIGVSVQPLKEKLEIEEGGIKFLLELCAYVEFTTDIKEMDILEVDSKKYRIVGVEDEGGQGHHLKLLLSKV